MAVAAPERLYFTGDDEADALIAKDPLALLIGFALDQQVSVQKAFSSPLELKRRLGSLDAETIARTDPGTLEEIFRRKPALHRYPASMARRGRRRLPPASTSRRMGSCTGSGSTRSWRASSSSTRS